MPAPIHLSSFGFCARHFHLYSTAGEQKGRRADKQTRHWPNASPVQQQVYQFFARRISSRKSVTWRFIKNSDMVDRCKEKWRNMPPNSPDLTLSDLKSSPPALRSSIQFAIEHSSSETNDTLMGVSITLSFYPIFNLWVDLSSIAPRKLSYEVFNWMFGEACAVRGIKLMLHSSTVLSFKGGYSSSSKFIWKIKICKTCLEWNHKLNTKREKDEINVFTY